MGWEVDCSVIKHVNHECIGEMYLTLKINEEISKKSLSPGVNNHFTKVREIIWSHYENNLMSYKLFNIFKR